MDVLQAASAAALEDVKALNVNPDDAGTPAADPAPAPSGTAESQTSTPEPTEATPAAGEPATPPVDPATLTEEELELIYKGQPVRVPKSDAIKLAQQGYDYTQKTMTLAEERRAFEAERMSVQAELQRQLLMIKDTLTNPESMKELVNWAAQQQGFTGDQVVEAAAGQPVQGLTAQQAQQMIQQQVAGLQRQFNTEIKRANYELETVRLEKEYSATINTHLQELVKTHPVLEDVDGINDLLRAEVAAQVKARMEANPNLDIPLKDTLGMFSKAAERRAAKIEARFQNRMKEVAVRQANVVNKGIEPSGGAAPAPSGAKPMKLGSAELRAAILADLSAG